MVQSVVEHGQCSRKNSTALTAVVHVQPLAVSSACICASPSESPRLPCARYPITAIGSTISLAGNPSTNASSSTPSMPISRPSGSSAFAHHASRLAPPMCTFASVHRIIPAGAATAAARPSTNSVRSSTERTITCPTCGARYGGSSSAKADGLPRSTVTLSSHVAPNVSPTLSTSAAVSSSALTSELPPAAAKNMVMSAMSAGNRPLHGMRLLVSTASSRSRSESMMRQPTTPAALQPRPMHIVSACLPHARQA